MVDVQAEHLSFPLQQESIPSPSLSTKIESFTVSLGESGKRKGRGGGGEGKGGEWERERREGEEERGVGKRGGAKWRRK